MILLPLFYTLLHVFSRFYTLLQTFNTLLQTFYTLLRTFLISGSNNRVTTHKSGTDSKTSFRLI